MLWAFALWGLLHIPANGAKGASVILFLSMIVLAFLGMLHIDARRDFTHGEDWERYRDATSIIPFAAVMDGKQTLSFSDIGGGRILVSLIVYVALLLTHQYVIGASPWPW